MKKVVYALAALIIFNSFCICKLADKVNHHVHEVQVVEVYTPVIVEYLPETEEVAEETTEETVEEETEPAVVTYDVPLSEELQLHIIKVSEENGIEPSVIIAMAFRESGYNANAVGDNGNSVGLLQIQSKWHWKRMEDLGCTDLTDPYQNVTVGVDYLAELLDRYGDIEKALTAYNRGRYSGTITEYATEIMTLAGKLEGAE